MGNQWTIIYLITWVFQGHYLIIKALYFRQSLCIKIIWKQSEVSMKVQNKPSAVLLQRLATCGIVSVSFVSFNWGSHIFFWKDTDVPLYDGSSATGCFLWAKGGWQGSMYIWVEKWVEIGVHLESCCVYRRYRLFAITCWHLFLEPWLSDINLKFWQWCLSLWGSKYNRKEKCKIYQFRVYLESCPRESRGRISPGKNKSLDSWELRENGKKYKRPAIEIKSCISVPQPEGK